MCNCTPPYEVIVPIVLHYSAEIVVLCAVDRQLTVNSFNLCALT